MAKKKYLKFLIDFSSSIKIPDNSYEAVDNAIRNGEMPLALALNDDRGEVSFGLADLYPDRFDGILTFERKKNLIFVTAKGNMKVEFGDFEREHIVFPCTLVIQNVADETPDSYYFGENEEGIKTNIVFESEEKSVK